MIDNMGWDNDVQSNNIMVQYLSYYENQGMLDSIIFHTSGQGIHNGTSNSARTQCGYIANHYYGRTHVSTFNPSTKSRDFSGG